MKSLPLIRCGGLLVWAGSVIWMPIPCALSQTLGEALNAPTLTWSTGGDVPWFPQTKVTHDGIAAAQTGVITNNQTSSLRTTIDGPGTLTFWWQVPFQDSHQLLFKMGGVPQRSTYGSSWKQETIYLASGANALEWIFTNSTTAGTARDAGQLDQVSFTPGPTAPSITDQPANKPQVRGLDATFVVQAVGTPPLSYQWQFDGTNIDNAQASSFTVTNVQADTIGSYRVIVSNLAGSTPSSKAILSLVSVAAWGGGDEVPPDLTNVLAVAVGDSHSLALRADGTVSGWGYNAFGQADPPATLTQAVAIAAGQYHSLALTAEGTVAAWGRNDYGQTDVPTNLTNVVAIAAGSGHCLALKADGGVAAWGNNSQGQSTVPAGLSGVVAIAAGLGHSMALKADGTVVVWGWNASGLRTLPVGLTNVRAIAAGFSHNLALKADGTVVAWGDNYAGAATVPSGLSDVVAIAGGTFYSLALKADGTVVAWGSQTTPVPSGLKNVLSIAGGGLFHPLARVGDAPPVRQVTLLKPTWDRNGFQLCLPTQSGRVYALEYLNAFSETTWTALPLAVGNGSLLNLTDPGLANSQRFYRVRQW